MGVTCLPVTDEEGEKEVWGDYVTYIMLQIWQVT